MKRTNKLTTLTILGLASLLGLGAIAYTSSNKSISVKADDPDRYIFVQVRDELDIRTGDTVIFAHENVAIHSLGGNPCFTGGSIISNNTGDYSKFIFESANAAMFIVEAGYNGLDQYSFKCLRTPQEESDYWLKTSGKYLSYAQGGKYNEDGIYINTKGDIIFRKDKDEFSSWNVDFDNDGCVHLSYATEANRYGQEGVESPIGIKWTSGYVSNGYFGYFFGDGNVRMYRKVNVKENNLNIWISTSPNKTVYNAGEYSDLTGMVLTIETKDTFMTFTSSYEFDGSLFSALGVVYDDGLSKGRFTWMGILMEFSATVYPDREEENNYLSTRLRYKDLRGTYVLAARYDGCTSILDLSQLTGEGENHSNDSGKVIDIAGEYNPISDSTYDNEGHRVEITDVTHNVVNIVKENDGYYIKLGSDYLAFEMSSYDYGFLYRGTKEHSKPINLGLNNEIVIKGFGADKTITCDRNLKKMYLSYESSNEIQVELHRLVLKETHYNEIDGFRASFFAKTATCDITGEENRLNSSDWQTLANEFSALSLDSQGYIASITYSHNQEASESIRDMADRYDLIVSKYSTTGFNDFMSREFAGTFQRNYVHRKVFPITNIVDSNILIIVIVPVILALAVTGFYILKKKRK